MTESLVEGRLAAGSGRWGEAFELLGTLDPSLLSAEDHEALAEAAFWRGHMRRSIEARESAYRLYLSEGRMAAAAKCAIKLATAYGDLMERPFVGVWLKNAENALAGEPEGPEHARLELERSFQSTVGNVAGDPVAALERGLEIAGRVGDKNVLALGLAMKGMMTLHSGDVETGMRLLEEATIPAVSGELEPYVTGIIYCMVISGSSQIADWQTAGQWTEAAKRWCERQSINGFPGVCRVHRAEVMRLRGSFALAEEEARTATEELLHFNIGAAGVAFRELGDVRMRMGELDAAEAAFRQAHEIGVIPQPGLALLQAMRGKTANAIASLRRAIDDEAVGPADRAKIFPVLAELALKSGDAATAESCLASLEAIASTYRSDALEAAVLTTRARLLRSRGELAEAESAAKRALRLWRSVDLLYDAAHTQMLLGDIYLDQDDKDAADFEYTSALSMLERFGAVLDAETVRQRRTACLDEPARSDESVRMAFLFSDIVGSTSLVDAIGDDAWIDLLKWHDEQLLSCFGTHHGTVVAHTGDGFFVAFGSARDAIGCAVDVQRRLAAHRRSHGFAPQVRIGVHVTEARRSHGNYHGKGIHEAARIGALAGGGEVLVSVATVEEAGIPVKAGDVREETLKGVAEPARVVSLDWRTI
ncbi:MAG TPA: adenylate/guanylate cyclase domain-containing protein [Actinomycetota bacterium]|nr:adenylate/guanylate cyclase domain-containing protein [Actinomycetota bacterium]